MLRRSFLKGAAALAAAPIVPALPASAAVPLVQTISAETLARGAICAPRIEVTALCMKVFDERGVCRVAMGIFD